MTLDKRQLNQMHQALLGGFDRDSLRMMVRLQLGENLDAVAGDDPLGTVIFDLITWAERTNRLPDLVSGALAANPTNPSLQQLAADYATWQGAAVQGEIVQGAVLLTPAQKPLVTETPAGATPGAGRSAQGSGRLTLAMAVAGAFALLLLALFVLRPLLAPPAPIDPTPVDPTLPALEMTSTPETSPTGTPEPSATVTPEPSPTGTPEPSATVTPEPSATVTPEPSATVTPEPSATATLEPSPTVKLDAPRAPALRIGSQYTAFTEASRLWTIKSGEALDLDLRRLWSAPEGTPVDCASGLLFFSWQVRQPYPGGEELEIHRLVPRGGGRTELLDRGPRGSASAGYCEQLVLRNLGLEELRLEWRYVSALVKGADLSGE